MNRPSIVPFVPVRGDSRSVPSSQILIQESPPEDARLLDAAHTLVNLQQTTGRQSRQNNNSSVRSDAQKGQEIVHTINTQSSSVHRNQLSIRPVGQTSAASPIVTHLQVPATTSISIVRSPIPIQMVGSPTSSLVVASLGSPKTKGGSPSNIDTRANGIIESLLIFINALVLYIYIYIYIRTCFK